MTHAEAIKVLEGMRERLALTERDYAGDLQDAEHIARTVNDMAALRERQEALTLAIASLKTGGSR